MSTATTTRRFEGHNARINAVSYNAESTVLASGSYDATVKLWDCKSSSRKPIQTLDEAKDSVMDVEILGTDIVTGCVDGRIRNYDMRMGRCVVDYVSTKGVTSVKSTEDGAAVLVSALDGKVRLMDKRNGKMLQGFSGHVNTELRVRSCFAEREEYVVSGSEDGIVWCWDLVSGECKAKLSGHGEGKGGKAVSCVDTKRSGGQMVTGGVDGECRRDGGRGMRLIRCRDRGGMGCLRLSGWAVWLWRCSFREHWALFSAPRTTNPCPWRTGSALLHVATLQVKGRSPADPGCQMRPRMKPRPCWCIL